MVNSLRKITVADDVLPPDTKLSPSIKCLGIVIDSTISWRDHIDNLQQKLSKICYLLKQLMNISNISVALAAYNGYFKSILNYGIVLWGSSVHCHCLFLLQKRAIRILSRVSSRTSCKSLFIKHKILTIYSMYVLEMLNFVHCNKNKFDFSSNDFRITRQTNSMITILLLSNGARTICVVNYTTSFHSNSKILIEIISKV